jgi:hypothetical protein
MDLNSGQWYIMNSEPVNPFGRAPKMRVLLSLAGLLLVFVQLPFGPFQEEKPKPAENPSPVKGWFMVSRFGVAPTQYSSAGKGIIKAESLGTRSSLFKKVPEKDGRLSVLSWKWKISNVVRSAIETRRDRYDAAARVIVVFEKEKAPSIFEGMEPSGLKIEYIWSSALPVGQVLSHPSDKFCKIFVVESGERKAGQWVFEERNLRKDYSTAFGTGSAELIALGIETDTDHSNERVTAYYSEPILKRK